MAPTLLNISHTNPDAQLSRTQKKITEHLTRVDGTGDGNGIKSPLETRLEENHENADGYSLDLIAHSSGGVLQLRGWDTGDSAECDVFVADCAEQLKTLGVKHLRLLGCNTAETEAARTAMRMLHTKLGPLGIAVFGTTVPIGARHFGPLGLNDDFKNVKAATELVAAPPPAAPPDAEAELRARQKRWAAQFEPFDGDLDEALSNPAIESLAAIFDDRAKHAGALWPVNRLPPGGGTHPFFHAGFLSTATVLPGLLAAPDAELLIEVPSHGDGPARFQRLSILLDFTFVRLYPTGTQHGILLPVDDPARLRDLVEGSAAVPPP